MSITDLFDRDEFRYIISDLDRNAHYPLSLVCKSTYSLLPYCKKPSLEYVTRSITLLEWALENGCPFDEMISKAAAANGRLDVLKWLTQHGCPWGASTWSIAAEKGHLNVVKWAYENNTNVKKDNTIYINAAKGGHIHVLEWAKAVRVCVCFHDDEYQVCYVAALEGHRETLDWLRKNDFEWDEMTCAATAKGGHLDVLKWLRAESCPWNCITTRMAAKYGHLDILEWTYENGCEMHEWIIAYAAQGGHIDVLKWLRSNGFEWAKYTMWWAAVNDRLDALKWVHENGCMCPHTRAAELKNCFGSQASPELIEWVRENLG